MSLKASLCILAPHMLCAHTALVRLNLLSFLLNESTALSVCGHISEGRAEHSQDSPWGADRIANSPSTSNFHQMLADQQDSVLGAGRSPQEGMHQQR